MFGGKHRFHDGLTAGRSIALMENDRPVWLDLSAGDASIRLVPSSANRILLDGLLLMLVLAYGDDAAEVLGATGLTLPAGGLHDLSQDHRYEPARVDAALSRENFGGKVIVAAFAGSSVLQQLPDMAHLPWEIEVLTPVYRRTLPAFGDGEWWQAGTLVPPAELA